MIRRRGMNVRYTHDEEALIYDLTHLREFAGVSADTMLAWLIPLREYGYSKDYMADVEMNYFRSCSEWSFWPRQESEFLVKVSLWHLQDVAHRLLEDQGFSCLVCGAHQGWADRGDMRGTFFGEVIHQRQTVWAPTLVCRGCMRDIPEIFSPWMTEAGQQKAVTRLLARCVPLSGEWRPDPTTGPDACVDHPDTDTLPNTPTRKRPRRTIGKRTVPVQA